MNAGFNLSRNIDVDLRKGSIRQPLILLATLIFTIFFFTTTQYLDLDALKLKQENQAQKCDTKNKATETRLDGKLLQ